MYHQGVAGGSEFLRYQATAKESYIWVGFFFEPVQACMNYGVTKIYDGSGSKESTLKRDITRAMTETIATWLLQQQTQKLIQDRKKMSIIMKFHSEAMRTYLASFDRN